MRGAYLTRRAKPRRKRARPMLILSLSHRVCTPVPRLPGYKEGEAPAGWRLGKRSLRQPRTALRFPARVAADAKARGNIIHGNDNTIAFTIASTRQASPALGPCSELIAFALGVSPLHRPTNRPAAIPFFSSRSPLSRSSFTGQRPPATHGRAGPIRCRIPSSEERRAHNPALKQPSPAPFPSSLKPAESASGVQASCASAWAARRDRLWPGDALALIAHWRCGPEAVTLERMCVRRRVTHGAHALSSNLPRSPLVS